MHWISGLFTDFDNKIVEKIDLILISKNVTFTKEANMFLSETDFGQFGRIIFKIFGNTTPVRMTKTEISFDNVLFTLGMFH